MLISLLFINMFTNNTYILASSSKSRYKILKNSGFEFKKINPKCDEEDFKKTIRGEKLSPENTAIRLSCEKAMSVSRLDKYFKNKVIGCDTLIHLNKKIFDKAKTLKEAHNKIKILSGKKHKIVSGITICKSAKVIWQCSVTTDVKIKKLTDIDIKKYLKAAGKEVLHSVGCYQIEGLGPNIIEDIKGDFFNVMGLPLFKLLKYTNSNI